MTLKAATGKSGTPGHSNRKTHTSFSARLNIMLSSTVVMRVLREALFQHKLKDAYQARIDCNAIHLRSGIRLPIPDRKKAGRQPNVQCTSVHSQPFLCGLTPVQLVAGKLATHKVYVVQSSYPSDMLKPHELESKALPSP